MDRQAKTKYRNKTTVCPEKETKPFLCNIFYKTLAILMKFGTPFPEQICCIIML